MKKLNPDDNADHNKNSTAVWYGNSEFDFGAEVDKLVTFKQEASHADILADGFDRKSGFLKADFSYLNFIKKYPDFFLLHS